MFEETLIGGSWEMSEKPKKKKKKKKKKTSHEPDYDPLWIKGYSI